MKMNTLVKSFALTAALATSFTASAELIDITVDEGYATQSASSNLVTLDKLNGGYVEQISFDAAGNFATSAFVSFGLFYDGSNTVKNVGLNNTYGLYATFNASGYSASEGIVNYLVGETGGFELFLDLNNDTKLQDESDVNSITSDSDDVRLAFSDTLGDNLATSTTIFGQTINAVTLDFWNVALTNEGENYFVSPNLFPRVITLTGDFDSLDPTEVVRGNIDVQFHEVPEPSTIAVLALGLIGLGASSRRKAK